MPTQPVATTLIPIDRIHPNPNQPRKYFDVQAIADLKESMEKRGLINPISVVKSGEWDYQIIAGERRYRAALELKWNQIDCRIWPAEIKPEEIEMLSLVENLQRADLNPFEVASGYKLLTESPYGMTHEDVADQCGQGRSTVSQYLMIGSLDAEVQDSVIRLTNLGFGHLLQICRLKTPEDQQEMAKKASEGDWTVKKLAAEVDKRLGSADRRNGGSAKHPSADTRPGPPADPAKAGSQPFQFKLSGREVLASARIPLDGDIDSELAKLKDALIEWLHTPQGRLWGQSPEVDLNASVGTVPRGDLRSPKPDLQKPRFPQTPVEQAELESIATGSPGPGPVYAWLFGAASPMTEAVQKISWSDLQVKDGAEGLPKILETLKKFWLTESKV